MDACAVTRTQAHNSDVSRGARGWGGRAHVGSGYRGPHVFALVADVECRAVW